MPNGDGAEAGKVGATDPRSVADAVGRWLSDKPWNAWCTLTFRAGNFTEDAATRAYVQWLDWLRAEGSPALAYFMGHEVGGQGGRLHLHGLVGNLSDYTSRTALWRWWFKRYGRAQVLRYDADRGAAFYVSKYVTKGLAQWDFDLSGFNRPRGATLFMRDATCNATASRIRRPRPCGRRTMPEDSGTA